MKKKHKIALSMVFIAFMLWIIHGPTLISDCFQEEGEGKLNKVPRNIIEKAGIGRGQFSIDSFTVRKNSYREIIELDGFAFSTLKENEGHRMIKLCLISGNEVYEVAAEEWDRPDTILYFQVDAEVEKFKPMGFRLKFSAMKLKNKEYKVGIIVKEDEGLFFYETKYVLKKKIGNVLIEQINNVHE